MAELDDDFDTCGPCLDCGRAVDQAGHDYCDDCGDDPSPMTLADLRGALEALAAMAIAEGLGDGFELAPNIDQRLAELSGVGNCATCRKPLAAICPACI